MTLGEKIKILRENREWTQAMVAEHLSISTDAVQKWEVGKNSPPISELKRLCALFDVSPNLLLDDATSLDSHFEIDQCEAFSSTSFEDGVHTIYDVGLNKGALLHRFNNQAGYAYSAIYTNSFEVYSCERSHEQQMIKYWNETEW